MNDRADFRNSIRRVADIVLRDDNSSAAAHATPLTDEVNKPALVKRSDAERSATPTKQIIRKAKRPSPLEWLMKRLKVTKQVAVDLPPELDEMVERASCGQRMDKKFPGWKKEIYSVAVVEWLDRNGWFRPADSHVIEPGDEDETS